MSLFGTEVKINGIPCAMIRRGMQNGEYRLIFEREFASLEQLEAINWRRPKLSGPCTLPAGYGFELKNINYYMSDKTWEVTLTVREQYLGDVTGYQENVDTLKAEKTRLEADIADKNVVIVDLVNQLAEADETAIALFEELEAVRVGTAEDNRTGKPETDEAEVGEEEEA